MSNIMKAVGSLFAPKMPKIAPVAGAVTQMPDPESPAALLAARQKMEQRRTRGREGTIYTGTTPTYSNQNLGGTQ